MASGVTQIPPVTLYRPSAPADRTMHISQVLFRPNVKGLRLKGLGSVESTLRLLSTGAGRRLGIRLWASRVFGRLQFSSDQKGSVITEFRRLRTNDLFAEAWQRILGDLQNGSTAFYDGRLIKSVPRPYLIEVSRLSPKDDLFHFSIHVENCLRRRQERKMRRFLGQTPTLTSVNISMITKPVFDPVKQTRGFLFDLNKIVPAIRNVFPEFSDSGTSFAARLLQTSPDGACPATFEMPVTFENLPMTLSIYPEDIAAPVGETPGLVWSIESDDPGIIHGPLMQNPRSHDPNAMLRPRLEVSLSPRHDLHEYCERFPFIQDADSARALTAGKMIYQALNRLAREMKRSGN